MQMYEILLVKPDFTGFEETSARFFVDVPDNQTRDEFIRDEEARSLYDVYLKEQVHMPELIYFTQVPCNGVKVKIFTDREIRDDRT